MENRINSGKHTNTLKQEFERVYDCALNYEGKGHWDKVLKRLYMCASRVKSPIVDGNLNPRNSGNKRSSLPPQTFAEIQCKNIAVRFNIQRCGLFIDLGEVSMGDSSSRLFGCANCLRLAVLCRSCDWGNKYCSSECAAAGRKRSLLRAAIRYQKTPNGARRHRDRQADYRRRQEEKVTHHTARLVAQGSIVGNLDKGKFRGNAELSPVIRTSDTRLCCSCKALCGPFLRRGYARQ